MGESNKYPERIRIFIKILGGILLVATHHNGFHVDGSFQPRRAMTTTMKLKATKDANQDDHGMILEREGNTKRLLVTVQI